jgi:uncharacterized protein (DUF362 family)
MTSQVSLIRGDDRYRNIQQAIQEIEHNLELGKVKSLLVKPNLVATERAEANTHPEAVRALLDFIRKRYDGEILIAEGAALCNTLDSFKRFGYLDLAREYQARLVDLNASDAITVRVFTILRRPMHLRLAKPVVESDFRISIGPPKTHNTVLVSLSLKNMVMGALVNPSMASEHECYSEMEPGFWEDINRPTLKNLATMILPGRKRSDKVFMHQGYPAINLNIAILASWVMPHLVVIDGFQGMEGNGPTQGDMVDWRVALAGTDAVAVDTLTAYLMGLDPARIGYLEYCRQMALGEGNLEQVDLLSNTSLEKVRRNFAPSPSAQRQYHWHIKKTESLLHPAQLVNKE